MLLRVLLGLLCCLTLVVVASALYRLHVYEQAYGFTELRLLVSFFEGCGSAWSLRSSWSLVSGCGGNGSRGPRC